MDERFDRVDEKFSEVDRRFDRVDEKFDRIDEKFDKVDGRIDVLNRTMVIGFLSLAGLVVTCFGGLATIIVTMQG